jgi:hypothetical protein
MCAVLDPNFFRAGNTPGEERKGYRVPTGLKFGLEAEPRCVVCPSKSVVCVWQKHSADRIGFYCEEHAAELSDSELDYVEAVGPETAAYRDLFERSHYGKRLPFIPQRLRDYLDAQTAQQALNPNRILEEVDPSDPGWESKIA